MIPDRIASLKFSLLSRGVYIEPDAAVSLTDNWRRPLFVDDYPTTNGITLRLPFDVYANASIAHLAEDAAAHLIRNANGGGYSLATCDEFIPVEPLPLPSYATGETSCCPGVASHADRVRLPLVSGCAFSCGFCDSPLTRYGRQDKRDLLRLLDIAVSDPSLPVRHALISGGTPRPADAEWYESTCTEIVMASPVPVDVMFTPRGDDFIDRLVSAGVWGLSINLEVFGDAAAAQLCPSKHAIGRVGYARAISRAVSQLGADGRVRSLMIAGLEAPSDTLAGVEFIASLGCDPVLSLFKPAAGTCLAEHPSPDPEMIHDLYNSAREIAQSCGVQLGPRCIPCQHNTITLPEPDSGYYYS